jgi:hypothetical protein
MRVVIHSAGIQDRDDTALVLDKISSRFPWLELVWADGGYNAWQVETAIVKVPVPRLEIVKRSNDMKGFVVLPRRWSSSEPSPGSAATQASPSSHSPQSKLPCDASRDSCLLSQALRTARKQKSVHIRDRVH